MLDNDNRQDNTRAIVEAVNKAKSPTQKMPDIPRNREALIALYEKRRIEVGLPPPDYSTMPYTKLEMLFGFLYRDDMVAKMRERAANQTNETMGQNTSTEPTPNASRMDQYTDIDTMREILSERQTRASIAKEAFTGIDSDDDDDDEPSDSDAVVDQSDIVNGYTVIDNVAAYMAGLPGFARGLYYTLVSRCFWPKNTCWVSTRYLAKQLGAGHKKVEKARDELIAAGLIRYKAGTGHGCNRYVIVNRSRIVKLINQNRDKAIKARTKKRRDTL